MHRFFLGTHLRQRFFNVCDRVRGNRFAATMSTFCSMFRGGAPSGMKGRHALLSLNKCKPLSGVAKYQPATSETAS